MNRRKTVYLVDDNDIVLENLGRLIDRDPGLRVIGKSGTGRKAQNEIPALRPNLAVIDLGLPDMNGIELIRKMKDLDPNLRMLVLSMHDEHVYGPKAVDSGAHGYLMKQLAIDGVLRAIHQILEGKMYLSDDLRAQLGLSRGGDIKKHNGGGLHVDHSDNRP